MKMKQLLLNLPGIVLLVLSLAAPAAASTRTMGGQADVAVSVTDTVAYALSGSTYTYTVVVSNNGNISTSGVMVTEKLPPYTVFDAATSSASWTCDALLVAATQQCYALIGVVDPGEQDVLTLGVQVDSSVPLGLGGIIDTAEVVDDGMSGDLDPNNNSSSEYTLIDPLFYDDFQDGIQSWNSIKGSWTEFEGSLLGDAAPTAIIQLPTFWDPSNERNCSLCVIQMDLKIGGGLSNRVFLQGWYKEKATRVDIIFKEEYDKIVVKHVVNGTVIAKGKADFKLDPGVVYHVEAGVGEGGALFLSINGVLLVAMNDGGVTPDGTVQLKVKNTKVTIPRFVILS